jgi:hypothetical protein
MRMSPRRWLLLALLTWAPLAVILVTETIAVDRCLDAGGSYDYDAGVCDRLGSHQFAPFTARHATLLRATAAITLALVLIGLFSRRRRKRTTA